MAHLHWHRHTGRNLLQTLLLICVLFGIPALAGAVLFGEDGVWVALAVSGIALLVEPSAAAPLTLRLYRARPMFYEESPELWRMIQQIAERASLAEIPVLHYSPSGLVNAFAVGNKRRCAIVISDGLLRTLSMREIAGVMAHEVAHIANGDLRVMHLADFISRLTALFALLGQMSLLLALPWLLVGSAEINWIGLLLLAFSPHLALIAQLGLSRLREFDADLVASRLSGDPAGLASALAKIEQVSHSWRNLLVPGWGNPEPSWLRTHPPTEERIRRLIGVATPLPNRLDRYDADHGSPDETFSWFAPTQSTPRWHWGGDWW